jgi:23S rRNA (adenine2503-C2)-methyltransferase
MNCNVNLIPGNATEGSPFKPSTPERITAFHKQLSRRGISSTVRRSLGAEIKAGCGQLRGRR